MSDQISLQGVERHVLSNGMTVLVKRDASAPVAAIVTYVNAGYFDEPDEVVGIAHVLEHMYFKGTARRGVGEIARETKSRGGYLNAHTIYDHTAYYTVLPASSLEAGLDIQADAYAESAIDAGELARELEVIIQEARRKLDSPGAVASETLNAVLFDRHRIRRWRIGVEEQLRGFTREDVVRFYRRHYQPGNTVLSIAGDVDVELALGLAEKYYGSLPDSAIERERGPAESGAPGFRSREMEGDISQAQLVMGWRTPRSLHPDSPALDMLAMALSSGRASRLYRAVRDRRLASSITASNFTPVELGIFEIHAELPHAMLRDAAGAIWTQLRMIRQGDLEEQELRRAKRILEASWLRRFENVESQAMWIASWEALGGWQLGEEYFGRLLSLTVADVADAARRYLDPDHASVVAYRPRGTGALAESSDALRAMLRSAASSPLPVRMDSEAPQVLSAEPRPSLERVVGSVRVYRTRNDLPILVQRIRGARMMHATVQLLGGAAEEDAERLGLTILMARAAVKGTRRRSAIQLAEELELNGGAIGASAGVEGFGWSLSAPLRYGAASLEILGDVVQEPVFGEDAMASERAALLGEIASARDDMFRQPVRLALEAAYGSHPYGRSVLGTTRTVEQLDSAAAVRWHESAVLDAPIALGIVGDADEDVLAAQMASVFGSMHMGFQDRTAVPEWPAGRVQCAEARDKAQTAIALALPSVARTNADHHVPNMIATIASGLGGRFFAELRDRLSLAYTVHATSAQRRLGGVFLSYIATSPEKEERAMRGLEREIEKLREEEVTRPELDQAIEFTLGARSIRLQSGAAVLGEMMEAWLYGSGLGELTELEENVRTITPVRILEFARSHLDAECLVAGIVRGRED